MEQEYNQKIAILEEELKRTQQAYHMAVRMNQFKSGFLARTTHELRSPLSSIISLHQIILADLCNNPEEEREFVEQAYQSAHKLMKILDDILYVSRVEQAKISLENNLININTLLDYVYKLTYLQAANYNFQLEIIHSLEDFYFSGDWTYLTQLLVLLIDATISFSQGGKITVSTDYFASYNLLEINIDLPWDFSAWSEPIDTLKKDASPDIKLSPFMNLLLAQELIQIMQGKLSVHSHHLQGTHTRLKCSLRVNPPETLNKKQ